MFADDTKVLITDNDVCAFQMEIDTVITELEIWFNGNDLTNKCK